MHHESQCCCCATSRFEAILIYNGRGWSECSKPFGYFWASNQHSDTSLNWATQISCTVLIFGDRCHLPAFSVIFSLRMRRSWYFRLFGQNFDIDNRFSDLDCLKESDYLGGSRRNVWVSFSLNYWYIVDGARLGRLELEDMSLHD